MKGFRAFRLAALLPLVLALAIAPSGCQGAQPGNLPLSGKKFAIVVKNEGNQYFEAIVDGFCAVIEDQGGTPYIMAPTQATADEQITIINELISDKVDCIAIATNSETALAPVLARAMEQGVQVLSFDSAADPTSRALHVNQADARRIALELMNAAADITGGRGQFAIMSTTNQANNQNTWIDEMRKLLEAGDYPDLTLVNIVFGEDDYRVTYEKTQYLIDNYPDLALIIAPTAAGIPAVAECITQNGLEGQIKVTGLGMPSQMADYIGPDRVCPYMFLWDLDGVGRLTAYAAIALVNGNIRGEVGDTLNAGTMGEYSVSEDPFGGSEIVLQADPIRFDESNIQHWRSIY
jgi:rhamnose transport system substrate-binding protein